MCYASSITKTGTRYFLRKGNANKSLMVYCKNLFPQNFCMEKPFELNKNSHSNSVTSIL